VAALDGLETPNVITGHTTLCPTQKSNLPPWVRKTPPAGRRYWMLAAAWISTFTVSATWSRNVLGSLIPHFT
jgi:hypothetical protein